jgi:hypothetical protein
MGFRSATILTFASFLVSGCADVVGRDAAISVGIKACSQFYTVNQDPKAWVVQEHGWDWWVIGPDRNIFVPRDGKPPDGKKCDVNLII